MKPLVVLLACSLGMNVILLGATGYFWNTANEARKDYRMFSDGLQRVADSYWSLRRYHDKDRRRTMLGYRLTEAPEQDGYRIEIFNLTTEQTVLDDILKTDSHWDAERAALEWIHDNG